jgi:putative SOS response-associated peptidase YedK
MRPVNARSEGIAGSAMLAESLRKRRCLVPADGFYEWRTEGKRKLPVHFRLKDRAPFAFAGIWDVWKGPSGSVFSCAILTTKPNELTGSVHDRMPVIVVTATRPAHSIGGGNFPSPTSSYENDPPPGLSVAL